MKKVKGYKVFNSDWTCKNYQYKVGGEYKMDDDIRICQRGFHFCKKLVDCFDYYPFDSKNKVAEIEALGVIQDEENGNKSVTNHIKIIKELSWLEVCDLVNSGKNNTGLSNLGDCNSGNRNLGNCNSGYCNLGNWNSGDCNSGNRNSGNWNSGNRNSGDCNSGNWNSGDWNSGYWNSGDCNSGNCNSGDWNSGDWNSGYCNSGNCNSGNRNSGYCNSGDWNSGIFNSNNSKLSLFNNSTNYTMNGLKEKYQIALNAIIYSDFPLTKWISAENMSNKEKKENPQWEILGGYLKQNSYKDAWKIAWKNMSKEEQQAIQDLPNFDKKIFKEITGITIRKQNNDR